MCERRGNHERAFILGSCQVAQLADRTEADLVVIVELVGGVGNSGVGHAVQVVEPPVEAAVRVEPVRGPPKVSRIDIGRQPFFVAVQLVGTNEMHLANE